MQRKGKFSLFLIWAIHFSCHQTLEYLIFSLQTLGLTLLAFPMAYCGTSQPACLCESIPKWTFFLLISVPPIGYVSVEYPD
jgi:hypothetical protein